MNVKAVPLHNGQAQMGGRGLAIPISVPVIQGGRWSTPSPGLFSPGKETFSSCTECLVDLGAGHVVARKSRALTGFRTPDLPSRNEASVCVSVCVCVYVCVCVCVCIYIYIYIFIYIYVCVYIFIYIYVYIQVYM
jgi:hypothetical protein